MHLYLVLLLMLSLSSCQASGPPATPQQVGLEVDRDTQRLSITWGGTNAPQYDILILRTEFMVTVVNETVEVKPDAAGKFRWTWTSEEPLECTSLTVTVRAHAGDELSDWSRPEILAGMDVPSNAQAQMYPLSRVVEVGSNTTFCCIIPEEHSFGMITYKGGVMDYTRLSRRSYATTRTNQGPSAASGTNVVCSNASKTIVTGAVVFVGYPPQPSDLLCETHDLHSAVCQWDAGPDTHLYGKRQTYYSLNGRNCSLPLTGRMQCGLEGWEGSWTLEAWNQLGRARLTDHAELSYRVRPLSASSLVATVIHPWNATLQWAWPNQTYDSLPLICQVQLTSHWHTSTQTFTGAGLDTAVLSGLQPDEEYSCRLRCGAQRNFWKWSGWSPSLSFTTSMDRPDAPDVWVWMDSNSTGRIIWKPLTKRESHGQLTSYEVTLWSPEENRQRSHILPQRTHSQDFSLGSPAAGVRVTLTASNAAGVSPPATVGIPDYLGDIEVTVSRAEVSQAGFLLSWTPPDNSSCTYLLEWHNSSCSQPCSLDWTHLPEGSSNTTVLSDWFQPGVRYTFSLYICPSQNPTLLQRWEAYIQEQAPSRSSPHVSSNQQGSGVLLTWDEVPLEHQRGFLLGYRIYLANASRLSLIANITDPSQRNYTVSKLPVGSYKFTVKSYNSAGEDGGSTAFISLEPYTDWLILEILVALGTMACFLAVITTLCYRKRKWVKTAFYPDIPEPSLPGDWSMPQGTLDLKPSPHSMVHILENPEWDSKEALVTVPEEEEEEEEEGGSVPADTDEPSALRYYNQVVDQGLPRQRPAHLPDSSASSSSSVDSARTDVTYTGIQASAPAPQPQPQPPPGGYRPQMHPASAPASPQASVEQEQAGAEGSFGGYKPQCSWKMESPVEGVAPTLGSPTSVTSSQFLLPDPDDQVKGQTSWFHSLLSGKP